jgi:hypothetical protein
MVFEIIDEIADVQIIATGPEIRVLRYLRRSLWSGPLAQTKGNGDRRDWAV